MSAIRSESPKPPRWLASLFDAPGVPPRARTRSGRAVRVLLVDDSSADRIRFGRALAKAGYEVQDVEDGSQAWQRLQEQEFDVVVSDRQMPGTDGIELIRLCRANPQLSRLPMIMVSAMDAPADREAGLAAGANEYICKSNDCAMPVLLHSVELLSRAHECRPLKRLYERVLIVDRSTVARHLLSCSLRTYCAESAAVATVEEARELDDGKISLVVLDATVEGALAWFEERCAWTPCPAFVVLTSWPSPAEETRVSMLGAIGYLPKPLAFRQLARTLVSANEPLTPALPRAHGFPLAEASIADPSTGEPQLSCQIVNLSAAGALLATAAAIPVGTPLLLWLVLDGHSVPTHARVARVQEPGWGGLAGCGVVFEYESEESRRFVERFVEARREQRKSARVKVG